MNKPASELIALADTIEATYLPANNGVRDFILTTGEREMVVQALRTAANQSGSGRAGSMAAQWTYDPEAEAYYFAPMQAVAPPYLKQRHVEAIIDIAADGTLAGVELVDNMPPPPALATPPAQPAPAATHGKPDGAVWEDDGLFAREYPLSLEHYEREAQNLTALWAPRNKGAYTCILVALLKAAHFPGDVVAMKEALKFYANPDNWMDTPSWDDGDPDCITPKAIPFWNEPGRPFDCGDIARKALAALHSPKAAETSPGDVLAMKEACKRIVVSFRHQVLPADRAMLRKIEAAIDRLDVKAEAKSQEPEAVAWQYRDCWKDHWSTCNERPVELKGRTVRPLFAHPTTKPEAPAVSVDAILSARVDDEGHGDGNLQYVLIRGFSAMGWSQPTLASIEMATAIASLIVGER